MIPANEQPYEIKDEHELGSVMDGAIEDTFITITAATYERIRKAEPKVSVSSDAISLYVFYAYRAKYLNSNQSWSNTKFTAAGMGWSIPRTRQAKAVLMRLGLISEVPSRTKDHTKSQGSFERHFIRVHYQVRNTCQTPKPPDAFSHPSPNPPGGCVSAIEVYDLERKRNTKTSIAAAKPPLDWVSLLPESLNTEGFKEAYGIYLRFRTENKIKPLTEISITAQFRKWSEYRNVPAVIAALEESVRQGWQGVFVERHLEKSSPYRQSDPAKQLAFLRESLANVGFDVVGQPEESARRRERRAQLEAQIAEVKKSLGVDCG